MEHRDIADPDLGGSFTLKIWQSAKTEGADGSWQHDEILLRPDSTDSVYEPIRLSSNSDGDVRAIAELVEVLS